MGNGKIAEYLRKNPFVDSILLCLDVASGLEYLHNSSPTVIHGDLKGANILVTPTGRACLADFGLSVVTDSQMLSSTTRATGTLRWLAPELMAAGEDGQDSHARNTTASDVFSFACVCYEIFSGKHPLHEIKNDNQIPLVVIGGRRSSRPTDITSSDRGLNDTIWCLVENSWANNAAVRPSASQIVGRLHSLLPPYVDIRPNDRTPKSLSDG